MNPALLLLLLATPAPAPPTAATPAPPRPRVAVLDLRDGGAADHQPAEGLAALLASEVARRPALAVISGADLRALLGYERQKQLVGCTGGACVGEVAGALGVTWLLSGELTRVGSSWLLSLALLDAGRGTSVSRLSRKAATLDALVDEVPGAVEELLAPLGPLAATPPTTRFDGEWEVALECPESPEAPGVKRYAFRFPATVKEGRLLGRHLEEGAPGSLRLEGTLPSDGRAQLTVHGLTSAPEYSQRRVPAGSPYQYGVSARFEASRGAGRRVEGRPCSFTFTRR